ncbi:hypothetical protein EVAR_54921_1 [Eumeta japonica]|uniref:Uncharacterized protein n=1 Tax=Eumeta variegata TaxID=151549 RepID=A0A4C1YB38_EUMVA|nr:hypothetical protein EVAR_54921_1 [Eumeta japonica]
MGWFNHRNSYRIHTNPALIRIRGSLNNGEESFAAPRRGRAGNVNFLPLAAAPLPPRPRPGRFPRRGA